MKNKLGIKTLYYYLLKSLIKKGGFFKAKKILDKVVLELYKVLHLDFESILLKIFLALNTFVEVRKINKRKRIYLVPLSIKLKRRYFLIVKWLIKASLISKKNEQNVLLSFSENLKKEIIDIVQFDKTNNIKSMSQKFRYETIQNVKKNRSNSHFRW